jgi:5'-nucleotidase
METSFTLNLMYKGKSMKTILLTNDDGVNAPGIRILKKELDKKYRCIIIAPSEEKSGTSHGLTLRNPVKIKKLEKDVYSLTGFPADCIYAGINGIIDKKPDFILSGINKGANLGIDVYYSGTAAGARQGLIEGVPSIALSLVCKKGDKKLYFENVAKKTLELLDKILKKDMRNVFFNINFPNIEKFNGLKATKLGMRRYEGKVVSKKDPRGNDYCWLWGDYVSFDEIEGSDCAAVAEGFISLTPILLDTTDYNFIKEVESWDL